MPAQTGGPFFVAAAITDRKQLTPKANLARSVLATFTVTRDFRFISSGVSRIDKELECVRIERHTDSVTIQLALRNVLAVPMTVENSAFYAWPSEQEQVEWLKRQTQGLLDIYGDARDGLVLSDQEVLERANMAPA